MTAPTTFTRASITAAKAAAMIDACEAEAAVRGMAIVTVVVDESGLTKAMRRMDNAPLLAMGAAHKKAYTAVGFGMATGRPWHDFIKDDPIPIHGAQSLTDFTLLGGGFPIVVNGVIVGAIGVSGGHYTADEACAQAGLAVLERW